MGNCSSFIARLQQKKIGSSGGASVAVCSPLPFVRSLKRPRLFAWCRESLIGHQLCACCILMQDLMLEMAVSSPPLLWLLTLQLALTCVPVWNAVAIRLLSEEQPDEVIKEAVRRWRCRQFTGETPPLTNRPLIGIVSQPGDGDGKRIISKLYPSHPEDSTISYIAASYVKFVESAGARAVPLIYNEPEEVLERKFACINGMLFPGGGASLKDGPFYRTAEKLFKMAIDANDKGDYFPVWGTCLGFELLSIIISQDHDVLEDFNATRKPGPLIFMGDWAKKRNMFKWVSADVLEKLPEVDLAMENHKFGLTPEKFAAVESLQKFFQVLTVTPDEDNKIYVSTVEAYNYPVTGVQWHPETSLSAELTWLQKNAFEWGVGTIPHSADAIKLTQAAANFLVSESRKSGHRPASEAEEQAFLIYNHVPIYSGKDGFEYFDQSYVFY